MNGLRNDSYSFTDYEVLTTRHVHIKVIETLDTHIRHPSHTDIAEARDGTDLGFNNEKQKTPNPCVAIRKIRQSIKAQNHTQRDIIYGKQCEASLTAQGIKQKVERGDTTIT